MTAALGVLAAAATLACIACLVRAHLSPTGYDPVRDPVSDYGVGSYTGWYAGAATSIGAAGLLVAAGLRHSAPSVSTLELVLLLVFAAARFLIPHFPTDLEGERPSRTGSIHLLLAAVAFAAICWAMCAIDLDRGTVDHVLPVLGYVATVCALGTFLSLRWAVIRPWTGLIERGAYAATLAWFVIVSVELVTS
jgi:hypothetical protein